jgi:hypothetical protein
VAKILLCECKALSSNPHFPKEKRIGRGKWTRKCFLKKANAKLEGNEKKHMEV